MDASLCHALVVLRDPEGAMDMLLAYYPDHQRDAIPLFSTWGRVRRMVYTDDSNRDPHYLESLQELHDASRLHADRVKLQELMRAPLHAQHRTYTQAKPYLIDYDLDLELKEIPACFKEFYRFQLPPHIVDFYHNARLANDVATQTHSRRNRERYSVSLQDANDIVVACLATIDRDIDSIADYYANVVAMQVLTGRRTVEVLSTLVWLPASHPMQATVSGIAKSRDLHGATKQHTIPLLCPYSAFDAAMTRLRSYPSPQHPAKCLARACERMFGRRLVHTEKRNLYAEMAWRARESNGFLIGDQSCSKHYWVSRALCHDFNLDHTSRYQTMTIA